MLYLDGKKPRPQNAIEHRLQTRMQPFLDTEQYTKFEITNFIPMPGSKKSPVRVHLFVIRLAGLKAKPVAN